MDMKLAVARLSLGGFEGLRQTARGRIMGDLFSGLRTAKHRRPVAMRRSSMFGERYSFLTVSEIKYKSGRSFCSKHHETATVKMGLPLWMQGGSAVASVPRLLSSFAFASRKKRPGLTC